MSGVVMETREGMLGWIWLRLVFLTLMIRAGYLPRLDLPALPAGRGS